MSFSLSVSVYTVCVCVCVTYRLMELRLNEPDFLLRVVQIIKSLKRKRERSFFPPTVFYRERGKTQEELRLSLYQQQAQTEWEQTCASFVTLNNTVSLHSSYHCDLFFLHETDILQTFAGSEYISYRFHHHFLSQELSLGVQNLTQTHAYRERGGEHHFIPLKCQQTATVAHLEDAEVAKHKP